MFLGQSPRVDAAAGTISVDVDGSCNLLARTTQHHSLTVRANLPFAPQLETFAATATFDCPPAPDAPAPSGTSPSGNTVVVTDQNQKKSGCAVATTSATPVSAIAWGAALGLVGLAVTRVRRRRSSAATRRR